LDLVGQATGRIDGVLVRLSDSQGGVVGIVQGYPYRRQQQGCHREPERVVVLRKREREGLARLVQQA
jgi:hypothetical protein